MFNQPVFTMEFIWRFWLVLQFFNNPHEVVVRVNLWSGCALEDAENELELLKESLLRFERSKEYTCDKTFEREINGFIEELRGVVLMVKKQDFVETFLNIVRDSNNAG